MFKVAILNLFYIYKFSGSSLKKGRKNTLNLAAQIKLPIAINQDKMQVNPCNIMPFGFSFGMLLKHES
jgi:hypothetical protein